MAHSLDPLLKPNSIAVIGASDTSARIGGRPLHFTKEQGYKGKIYPVNAKRDTVQGLRAYRSIKDVPEAVDAAVVSVPTSAAVDVIRDCAECGVKSVVIFTSGFAEMGEAEAQAEISAIASESGMRMIGPNCLGIFNIAHGWFGTFTNAPGMIRVENGTAGIISQSGAYGSHLFLAAQQRGVGANYWVTTGNEADVDVAEVIEYYALARDVDVILAYAEGVKDADRICRALEMARDAEKPVVFMKVGTTDVGARAAVSHTASLAGADAVYEALFRQYGVYRAETTEELADVAYACQFGRFPAGNKISLQTISGGVGVQMADASVKRGLDVAPLPESVRKKLKDMIPYAGVNNPVDFTAQALNDPDLMDKNVSLTIDEADYDSHIIYMASVPASPFTKDACLSIFGGLKEKYPEETMVMSMQAPEDLVRTYEAMGYPCFDDPSLAVRAMAALTRFGDIYRRGRPDAPPALPDGAMAAPARPVAEHEAKEILARAGIPVTKEGLADSAEAAVELWRGIGGPAVMKIASPDIRHKTEIGGVLLDINGAAAASDGYRKLIERAAAARPDARIDGVIVAGMVSGGVETVMGVVSDPVFGPAVMFGLGGVFVEILKDVTFRLAPFGIDEARLMIDEIQGRAMLDGVRGAPPADVEALAEALARLSVFAAANADTVETIDVNPFIALPEGAVAVDALIVPKTEASPGDRIRREG